MREILFKAKRIDNGKWVEGCLVIDHSRSNLFEYRMQPVESGVLYAPPIDPETLCQFTGLCDKYGNKIWENDIVKTVSDIYAPVKFGLYTTGFALEECNQGFYVDFPDGTCLRHELGYWNNKVEVRGNIFDNPELLQEESNE
nr:MAG TPA: YopX protein [Caudoviricetes sp.]